MNLPAEVGRELRVSELVPETIVVLNKGDNFGTLWVVEVVEDWVAFMAGAFWLSGAANAGFVARRCGPDLEQITDNTGAPMKIFEYLGEP